MVHTYDTRATRMLGWPLDAFEKGKGKPMTKRVLGLEVGFYSLVATEPRVNA